MTIETVIVDIVVSGAIIGVLYTAMYLFFR